MNTLLVELRRSMEELQLGLDGALNMSDKMEALARGIATNTVRAQAIGCAQQCNFAVARKQQALGRSFEPGGVQVVPSCAEALQQLACLCCCRFRRCGWP